MADLASIAREAVEAFNASDWERSKAIMTPDYVYNELGTQRRLEGRDAVIASMQGWLTVRRLGTELVLSVNVTSPRFG